MNNQQAWNKVYQHFIVKRNPFSVIDGRCKYNGGEGIICAFAVLVPENLRPTLKEGGVVSTILSTNKEINEALEGLDFSFLNLLQLAHDEAGTSEKDSYEVMYEKMIDIAKLYSLEYPQK